MTFLRPYTAELLSLFRIMTGLLILEHGTGKYLNFPVGEAARNNVDPMTLSGAAGALELVGGALLTIGLFTRPVAFILSGLMAFAYFIAHHPRDFFPILNGGELAIVYCFALLYLAAAGGGSISADRMIRGSDA